MKREEILKTVEYWTSSIQLALFAKVEQYLEENQMTKTQLAEKLGVSKGYVSQILNGDFDHRLSKLVEISIAIGYYPGIKFTPIDDKITRQKKNHKSIVPKQKTDSVEQKRRNIQ